MSTDYYAVKKPDNILERICFELRKLIEDAVKINLCDGLLFSGGLDTSILAFTASKYTALKAFTVALNGAPAPDVEYASLVARRLGFRHYIRYFCENELNEALHETVKVMRSFDPMEIRNSAAIYIALSVAKEEGLNAVMTGDGSDELFAGYSFLFNLEGEELKLKLKEIWKTMSFSSIPLSRAIGMEARLPYLDPRIREFASKLDPSYLIREERGRKWGKWILRKAFEGMLPDEIIWRIKTPIEHGSGTTILPDIFNQKITDEEFQERKRKYLETDRVVIRSKEQLLYYEIFRSVIGVPHPVKGDRTCPYCNSDAEEEATYCRTCGYYPI
jgi:asparagine synthase (glutamine-hydrolysing)